MLYDFLAKKEGFSNCTVMLRTRHITSYGVSRTRLSFGAGLAALLVDTQAVHALCKMKRAPSYRVWTFENGIFHFLACRRSFVERGCSDKRAGQRRSVSQP
jgi:hypothetical protein